VGSNTPTTYSPSFVGVPVIVNLYPMGRVIGSFMGSSIYNVFLLYLKINMCNLIKTLDKLYEILKGMDPLTLGHFYSYTRDMGFNDISYTINVYMGVYTLKTRELFNFNMLKGRAKRLVLLLKDFIDCDELIVIEKELIDYFKHTNRVYWDNISDVMDLLS
jgi:hypothetical protein